MAKSLKRYKVVSGENTTLELPLYSEILSAAFDGTGATIDLWVVVELSKPVEKRTFYTALTGPSLSEINLPDKSLKYITCCDFLQTVRAHLFEIEQVE